MDAMPPGGCAYDGQCDATYMHVAGGATGAVRSVDLECSCPAAANRSSAMGLRGNGTVLAAKCVIHIHNRDFLLILCRFR